jgi:thioredoxin reductase
MIFDVLIIGGGVAGMQCALVLGSAKDKWFASDKKIGIIAHQKASHLQTALFNNVLGLKPGTLGKDILIEGKQQLSELYPQIIQIDDEKVSAVYENELGFEIITNKQSYQTKIAIISLNYAAPFLIKGLEKYIEPHQRADPEKNRIQLKNKNHLVQNNLYVCGTIAGYTSQFAIAAGIGASVATDILTLWNNNIPTKIHDKI